MREIIEVPVNEIIPDPSQPRKDFSAVAEIAATLEVQNGKAVDGRGILEPVALLHGERPPFMLKNGETRWRAAKQAGLDTVPAYFVADDTPDNRLADQIKTGATQRPHKPLETADAVGRLSSAEALFRTGLSPHRIRQCKAIAGLAEPVKEAMGAGEIDVGLALALATITSHDDQKDALVRVKGRSLHGARALINDRYHLRLADCGFDTADASLPGGPCETCPKNTKQQRDLFSEAEDTESRCTDKACFDKKRDLTWRRRKAAAEVAGVKVVDGEAAKKILSPMGGCRDEALVTLDGQCGPDYELAQKEMRRPRTWRQVIGDVAPSMLVRDERGRVHELVTLVEARDAAERAGLSDIAKGLDEDEEEPEIREPAPARTARDLQKERAAEKAKRAEDLQRMLGHAAIAPIDARLFRFLCGMAVRADYAGDAVTAICERLKIGQGAEVDDLPQALLAHVAELENTGTLLTLLIELLVYLGQGDALEIACRFFGVGDASNEPAKCEECGGDGFFKGPRLGDEPCPKCEGAGKTTVREEPAAAPSTAGAKVESGICRICGYTRVTACDDIADYPGETRACHWADPNETLCSACAGLMQEIVDLLRNGSDRESVVAALAERYGWALVNDAIADMLSAGEIAEKDGVPVCPICNKSLPCENCKKLGFRILTLCKEKPRLGPQIKAGCRQWDKKDVHATISWLVVQGLLDTGQSGFGTSAKGLEVLDKGQSRGAP